MKPDLTARIRKHMISPILEKNYYIAKAFQYRCFYFDHFQGKQPVIVYQMGKVGSSTMANSLRKIAKSDMSIYHVHYLNTEDINHSNKNYYGKYAHFFRRPFPKKSSHLLQSQYLIRQINKRQKNRKRKIVTLVRDPVARNISSFFQLIDFLLPSFYEQYRNHTIKIEELIQIYLERFGEHHVPLEWIDKKLKPVFGIDVFASDFSTSKGYHIYKGDDAEILLFRLENLNECAPDAFREFLNIEHFTPFKENVASEKAYHNIYREFINALVLPEAYLNMMYTSKYVRHFYIEEEIEAFWAKWHKQDALVPCSIEP